MRRLCLTALDQSSTSIGFGAAASLLAPASISPIQQLIKLLPPNHSYSTAAATATAAASPVAEPVFQDVSSLPPLTLAEHTLQGQFRDVEVPLYDLHKQPIGNFILDGDIFDVPIRRDILHRVVRWQLARRQQGTHKTKTRSEVRGGGRKPWNQKGSGRARQGTIRAPQWRGGGVAHGPVPRTHEHDLQKRVRRLGLKCALSAKAWERRVIVVDSLRPADFKTKTMDGHVAALLNGAARRSVLMVDSDKDGLDGGENLRLGIANLPWVDILPSVGVNVYSLLQRDYLVITKDAVESLVGRLRRPIKPCSITP
ncbi:putative 50S ribosomal protein L4 [Nannochloris sp. 'desiccata']|nr:putative 50S ribosomal protein L4 [Chlorella desiccata (nom. nud.)]